MSKATRDNLSFILKFFICVFLPSFVPFFLLPYDVHYDFDREGEGEEKKLQGEFQFKVWKHSQW